MIENEFDEVSVDDQLGEGDRARRSNADQLHLLFALPTLLDLDGKRMFSLTV